MTAIKIRQKVHSIIDNADDRILKVVYAMLKEYEKAETEPSILSDKQKSEVDRRWNNHKNGKSKSYSIDEVNKFVTARLNK